MSSWVSSYRPKKRIILPLSGIPVLSSNIYSADDKVIPSSITDTYISINTDDLHSRLERFNHLAKLITFIIPTIGRDTLPNAIQSLFSQTINDWKAIIVFDGINEINSNLKSLLNDDRILYLTIEKTGSVGTGVHGTAGSVRNIGMEYVNTPWIGFLDDDDKLTPDYCKCLLYEINITPKVDVISFKMYDKDNIIPPVGYNMIIPGMIGISFCFKSYLFREGFKFKQSGVEDYTLLKDFENAKLKIVLSPFVCYIVRNSNKIIIPSTGRYIIN